MLTITDTPMVEITEVVQPCFQELPVELCEPCRQLNTYLPKIKAPTLKQNSKIKVFAKAMLEIDDELMQKICNLCFTAETEDCNCLLLYGKSVGAETSYFTIDSTNCMKFGYKKTVNQCCNNAICKREVFAFCQQLCQVCNFHSLDVCNNEADFEFYKKIVKFKAKYFNKAPTRKNIVDALIDWFGAEAHVLDAIYPEIFWSLGRAATEQELAIMPFVYSMMPVYDGIDLIFTQEL